VERYFDRTKDSPLGCTDLVSHWITLLEDAKRQPFYAAPHRQGGRRNVEAEDRVGVELALPHGVEEGRSVPVCYRLPRSERPVEEGVLSSPQHLPYT
jgi:hypothetical protein